MKTTLFYLYKLLWMLFFCVCCLFGNSVFALDPDVENVLNLYAKHQSDISKVYIEYECFVEGVGEYSRADFKHLDNVPLRRLYAGTFACDGSRYSLRQEGWGYQNPLAKPQPKEAAGYASVLWTKDNCHQYTRGKNSAGIVFLCKDKEEIDKRKSLPLDKYTGKFLLGYPSASFSTERIDAILRKASKISLRKSPELVGNSSCVVVDAETDIGSFTVWFDPQRQYNISQMKMEAKEGHLNGDGGEPLPRDVFRNHQLTILEYESVNGLFVPKKSEAHGEDKYPNGEWRRYNHEFLAKRITLNPDFDKLDLFGQSDIRDGASASIIGRPGVQFVWKNEGGAGSLKPKMDDYSLRKVVSEVDIIKKNANWKKTDSTSSTLQTQAAATPAPPKIAASPTPQAILKEEPPAAVRSTPTDNKNWIYASVFAIIAICLAIYIKKM